MRNLKLITVLLVALFIGVINVDAQQGYSGRVFTGLCALPLANNAPRSSVDWTCRYADTHIGSGITITGNGQWPIVESGASVLGSRGYNTSFAYQANMYGQNRPAMCLDPGLSQPNPANYGRSMGNGNLEGRNPSVLDQRFAAVMAHFVHSSISSGNWNQFHQAANVALRAVMSHHGGVTTRGNNTAVGWRQGDSPSIVAHLQSNSNPGSTPTRFYQCAMGNGTNCGQPAFFPDIAYEIDTENVDKQYDDANFQYTFPVTITGLEPFTNQVTGADAAFFRLIGFDCDDEITCSLVSGPGSTTPLSFPHDLLSSVSGDEAQIYIAVHGPRPLDGDCENFSIGRLFFEYWHVLSADNVRTARTHLSGNHISQRMIIFLTQHFNRPAAGGAPAGQGHLGIIEFEPDLIEICEECECIFEPCAGGEEGYCFSMQCGEDGTPTPMTFRQWLEEGCCPPPAGDGPGLPSSYDQETYFEVCLGDPELCDCNPFIDQVSLAGHCPPPGEEAETIYSFVRQLSIEVIMASVMECQEGLLDVAWQRSEAGVQAFIECIDTMTKNARDDVYLFAEAGSSPPIEENMFCRLFTSEESQVNYPGQVTNAWGGTYFSFVRQGQPNIEASIDAHFFFNIEHWRIQYYHALNDERDAWTRYQRSSAWVSAIANLEDCNPITCSGTSSCSGEDCVCPSCSASGYNNTNDARADSGTYHNADGIDLSLASEGILAVRTCNAPTCGSCSGCSDGSQSTTPNPYDPPAVERARFLEARAHRIQLEEFYDQCADRVDIRDQWEWLHNPEMIFVYEQMAYNAQGGPGMRLEVEVNRIPMIPVCPPGGECPEEWARWDEMSRTTRHFWPNYSIPREETGSGCARNVSNEGDTEFVGILSPASEAFDPHEDTEYTDCYIGFEETIFFKSGTFFQALAPTGMFMTDEQFEEVPFDIPNIVDVDFVMNIRRTAYRGIYDYWFVVEHLGHHKGEDREEMQGNPVPDKDPIFPDLVHRSNIQHSIDRCITDANSTGVSCSWQGEHPEVNPVVNSTSYAFNQFVRDTEPGNFGANVGSLFLREFSPFLTHQCTIFVENLEQEPPGEICVPDDPSTWTRPYFNRPISLTSITPSHRDLSQNWVNGKGQAALLAIEAAGDNIFQTPEYQFQIGPQDTAWIREQNRARRGQGGFNDFNLECNDYAKECISEFLTQLDTRLRNISPARSLIDGRDRWRYFENGAGFNWHNRGSFSYPRFLTDLSGCETNPEICYWP